MHVNKTMSCSVRLIIVRDLSAHYKVTHLLAHAIFLRACREHIGRAEGSAYNDGIEVVKLIDAANRAYFRDRVTIEVVVAAVVSAIQRAYARMRWEGAR